ncbi:MAG: hypothetical protein K5888_03160 [Lachnospiraceae bacterium]|nr:hypothetical protein [Lachnospiraceae bacterium]
MDVKERVWLCRVIEKIKSQPEFSERLRIQNASEVVISQNMEEERSGS